AHAPPPHYTLSLHDALPISTWRLDIKRAGSPGADDEWVIAEEEKISSVENLYRLALNTTKQFSARGLKISAEDIDLTLAEGSVRSEEHTSELQSRFDLVCRL